MAMITWSDDFSVNVKEIDNQHKELVVMLNEFYEAIKANESKPGLEKLLGGLARYAVSHFATEEKYFDKFNWEHSEAHKAVHTAFLEKVTDVATRFSSGKSVLSLEITTFLKNWLLNHIKVEDKQYSKCFNDNGLK